MAPLELGQGMKGGGQGMYQRGKSHGSPLLLPERGRVRAGAHLRTQLCKYVHREALGLPWVSRGQDWDSSCGEDREPGLTCPQGQTLPPERPPLP